MSISATSTSCFVVIVTSVLADAPPRRFSLCSASDARSAAHFDTVTAAAVVRRLDDRDGLVVDTEEPLIGRLVHPDRLHVVQDVGLHVHSKTIDLGDAIVVLLDGSGELVDRHLERGGRHAQLLQQPLFLALGTIDSGLGEIDDLLCRGRDTGLGFSSESDGSKMRFTVLRMPSPCSACARPRTASSRLRWSRSTTRICASTCCWSRRRPASALWRCCRGCWMLSSAPTKLLVR